jgi:hypothetical protein
VHQNAIYSKLAQALAETETRFNARLDALQAKIDRLIESSAAASPDAAKGATPKKGPK